MAIRVIVRENVLPTTAFLTIVSLLLVFGAVLGMIPRAWLPDAPSTIVSAIPHVNAVISLLTLVLIGIGWHAIRRGAIERHRSAMLASVFLFATFLVLYLYRLIQIGGASPFPGPTLIYQWVYLPILVIHMGLAILCIPLLYFVLLVALTHSPAQLRDTNHPTIGRVAAPLWMISFALGIVVYLLLYIVY